MSKILKVKARQVFDSRGNPTVEAEVYIKNNSALAICPSGASTGTYEAYEKRDLNNKRYLGKSVLNAVNLINSKISKKLKGLNVHNQEKIDAAMINLDGTRQKTKLGANTILNEIVLYFPRHFPLCIPSPSIPAADSSARLPPPISLSISLGISLSVSPPRVSLLLIQV